MASPAETAKGVDGHILAAMSASRAGFFPPWLTRAKVHPVRPRVALLKRPALDAKLAGHSDARITVVCAPAGFGKTTALVSWRDVLVEKGFDVAWLSLDSDDNDPYQFVMYVALSISAAGVDLHDVFEHNAASGEGQSARRLLNILHSAVERHDENVVLMMDDFDNLGEDVVDTIVEPLIRYASDNFHLAFACRDDSALKTSDLELGGFARRFGAPDLRFTMAELLEFVSPSMVPATVKRLHGLTEGWPVAVQLLRAAVSSRQEISDVVANLAGDNSMMAGYLSEQVFDRLTGDVQTFLMEISIVDRVDRDLADHLRDRDDSTQYFNDLKKLDALVSSVDAVHHSFRLHPIFREYLHGRLTAEDPRRAGQLHRRAAQWYADHGHLLRAVRHFVEGNDHEQAAVAIEESGGLLTWIRDGLTRLRAAMQLLDPAVVRARPRLALIQCLMFLKTGRPHDARTLFDATVSRLTLESGSDTEVHREVTIIGHLLHAYGGAEIPRKLFDTLENELVRIPPGEHFIRAHHLTMLCGLNSSLGNFSRARRYGREAIRAFRAGNSIYGEVYIRIHLGDAAYGEGDSAAAAHYRKALGLIRRNFSDDGAVKLIVDVLQAELRYSGNRIESIPRAIDEFPKRLEHREAWLNVLAAAYTVASNVTAVRSGIDAALKLLEERQHYPASQRMTSLQRLIAGLRMTLMLRADRVRDARAVLVDSGLTTSRCTGSHAADGAWRERDVVGQGIARLLIAEGRADDALAEIAGCLHARRESGHRRSCTTYHILCSLAHDRNGDEGSAASEMRNALALSVATGELRAFVDEGRAVHRILGSIGNGGLDDQQGRGILDRARTIRAAFAEERGKPLEHRLTDREIEVLRELVGGHPNKVIARNMGISHNTVRFHLKNIFAKMHVDSRLRAVSAAVRANIL